MSFDQLVRPTFAEARSTALQEGYMYGLVPGVVTNVDDPEKIGRVQVECSIIEQGVNLPNSNDGWIPVMESFVVNSMTGGSHSFIQVGSQVVMSCLFGDPRQMIVVGCLPSRVDRPHPDLDRASGTYGSATPNETIEAYCDTDNSAVISRPNGVLQTISGEGDLMIQTEERGRMQLRQDGTASLSNDLSHTILSKDGEVSQRSAAGAASILRADGKVEISSSSAARLQLDGRDGLLEGPLNSLSQAIAEVRTTLSGALGKAQGLLTDLEAIAQDFLPGSDLESFLNDAGSVLEELKGLNQSLGTGSESLQKLQGFSVEELGRSLLPQVAKMAGLGDLTQQIEPLLQPGITGEVIAQRIVGLLPDDLAKVFPFEAIATVLDGLQHDQPMQLQAILGAVLPDGFRSIRNIIGLDLHRTLNQIKQAIVDFQAIPLPPDAPPPTVNPLDLAVRALRVHLPSAIAQLFDDQAIASILQSPNLDDAIQTLLGESLAGITTQASKAVEHLQGAAGTLEPLGQVINGLLTGVDSTDALQSLRSAGVLPNAQAPTGETLRTALLSEAHRLAPAIATGLRTVNRLLNAVPSGEAGAKIRATQTIAQMETYLGSAGAIAQVTPLMASLVSPGGTSQIFAGVAGAGLMSPLGSFSFGIGGGSLVSTVGLALQTFQSAGRAAGIRLSPEAGVSLGSYAPSAQWDDETVWQNDTARVSVLNDVVTIESRANGAAAHYIRVSPQGIFLDGIDVAILPTLVQDLQGLVTRIAALESAGSPPPP